MVSASRAFSDVDAKIGLFGRRGTAWTHLSGINTSSGLPSEVLDRAVQDTGAIWESGSLLIRLSAFDDAIAIVRPSTTVPVADQGAFQERLVKLLDAQVEQSLDRHAATTDLLTALPNRAAFDIRLREALARWANPPADEELDIGIPYGVWVVLYDLDNFKQANDTFGHEYGDLLLQSFAWEFADSAKFQLDGYPAVDISCEARLGGEEFALLISGRLLEADVHAIADSVRGDIEAAKIPRREHWLRLKLLHGPEIELQRRIDQDAITASVGWSGVYDLPGTARAELSSAERLLKANADIAMYSSKEYGRNQTRSFRSVRRAYGKVLEHTDVPSVTAIDIGSSAGVEKENLFEVFDPKFIGDQPFTVRGPRSEKKLGVYPRISSGRIRVSETVQREISFCTSDPSGERSTFVAKSRVFLFDDLTKTYACKLDYMSLRSAEIKLGEQIELGRRLVAVAFRVRRANDTDSPYREAIVDSLLSGITDGIVNDTMTVLLRVETAPNEVALLFAGPSAADTITKCTPIVDRISRIPVGMEVSLGIFASDQPAEQGRSRNAFSPRFALRYAAAAARMSASSSTWVQVVDHTPAQLIKATLTTVGIVDALNLATAFIEDGIVDQEMDQTIGIAATESHRLPDSERDLLAGVGDRLSAESAPIHSREVGVLLNARLFGYGAMRDTLDAIAAQGPRTNAIRAALFLARVESFRDEMKNMNRAQKIGEAAETEIRVPEQATALAEELKEVLRLPDLSRRMMLELKQVVTEFKGTGIEFPQDDSEGRQ